MTEPEVIEFSLEGRDYIELNNLLKITGLCSSGGEAKTLISEGNLKVDGHIELRKRCKLRPDQKVSFKETNILIKP